MVLSFKVLIVIVLFSLAARVVGQVYVLWDCWGWEGVSGRGGGGGWGLGWG